MALYDILWPGVLTSSLSETTGSGSVGDTQNFILEFSQLATSGSIADVAFGPPSGPQNSNSPQYGLIYEFPGGTGGATDYAWIG